jgi:hypothetical protein
MVDMASSQEHGQQRISNITVNIASTQVNIMQVCVCVLTICIDMCILGSSSMWYKVCFAVALPAVLLFTYTSYVAEQNEHHKKRPEFIEYPFMYKRDKACIFISFCDCISFVDVPMAH